MFKKSKRNTISKIIEDNLDYLVRFAYFRLGNRVEAEDLVYDAILKFLEKSTGNIKPESVRLYLFRIVHNLCLDKMRMIRTVQSRIEIVTVVQSPESRKRLSSHSLLRSRNSWGGIME